MIKPPLLVEFKEDTLFKAVILISLISCMSMFLSIHISLWLHDIIHFNKHNNNNNDKQKQKNIKYSNLFFSLIVCFLSSVFAYYIVIYLFDYGKSLTL